jgi:lipid-A-disaccharide synthase
MKYYFISGEASGDLHASKLMRELRNLDHDAVFRCWGGDLMQQQGGELVKHYRDLSFMGFMEVLLHIRSIASNFSFCKKDLLAYNPDVLILVDYPGFNLRIARFAHKKGIRVFYYISPQLWAWHSSRVRIIRKCVDRMFVILPFEKEFYMHHNVAVDFIGHPLLDEITGRKAFSPKQDFLKHHGLEDQKPLIALLPGSRKQEISKILQIMVKIIPDFPGYQFAVAGAPSVPVSVYQNITSGFPVAVISGSTYELLHHSDAALVTSGTATLETALIGTPQVVCYRGTLLSFWLARLLVHVKYISLVNLVMDKQIVVELIQGQLTRENLLCELKKIMNENHTRNSMSRDYEILREKLGGPGASERAARLMIQYLRKK